MNAIFVMVMCLMADIGSPIPPLQPVNPIVATRPAGEGWQYDASRGHWFRYVNPTTLEPRSTRYLPVLPTYPVQFPQIPTLGGCPGGVCPKR